MFHLQSVGLRQLHPPSLASRARPTNRCDHIYNIATPFTVKMEGVWGHAKTFTQGHEHTSALRTLVAVYVIKAFLTGSVRCQVAGISLILSRLVSRAYVNFACSCTNGFSCNREVASVVWF